MRGRPGRKSFVVQWPNLTCTVCLRPIEVGERARFDDEGLAHHISHPSPDEVTPDVCTICHLVKPCWC